MLWAWALFVVAGSAFAKFAEHWDAAAHPATHPLPAVGFAAVRAGALLGGLLVLAAAAVALPAFVRAARAGQLGSAARPLLRAAVIMGVTAVATVAFVAFAHHLGSVRRNNASLPFLGTGAAWVALVVASIWAGTAASSACARVVDLTNRQLRQLGGLALAAASCMLTVASGVTAWWIGLASAAPAFLATGPSAVAGSPFPPALMVAAALMAGGLALAIVGAVKVGSSLSQLTS